MRPSFFMRSICENVMVSAPSADRRILMSCHLGRMYENHRRVNALRNDQYEKLWQLIDNFSNDAPIASHALCNTFDHCSVTGTEESDTPCLSSSCPRNPCGSLERGDDTCSFGSGSHE